MYTEKDAQIELSSIIDDVVMTRDVEGAYKVARIFAEQDDMESADHFRKMARRWQREDDYHDEVNGN